MARTSISLLCLAAALAAPVYAELKDAPSTQVKVTRPSASPRMVTSSEHLRVYPEQNGRTNPNWGSALTDIVRHLPASNRYQDAYARYTRAGDLVTAGHEWTHFLNEYLGLSSGSGQSSYYMLDNHCMTLADPEGLRGIVPEIPISLRGELYQLYLVENRGNARVDPLYLFDEWTAYANDVTVAVNQLLEGKPLNPFQRDAIQTQTAGNVLEFTFYGFAVGMAVKQHDPQYYRSEQGAKLRGFIALNAQRSMAIYRQALQRRELSRGDARNVGLLSSFRNSEDTLGMRAWVRNDLGEELARTLGIDTGMPQKAAIRPR